MKLDYQINIYSFYQKFINKFITIFIEHFKKFNHLFFKIKITKLPIKSKKFTVLRSPHVNKKSKEQFESNTYKTLINISTKNENQEEFITLFLDYFKYLNIGKKYNFLPIKLKIKQKALI